MLGDGQLFGFYASDFLQAQLVDGLRIHVGGGGLADREAIQSVSVWQCPHAGFCSALGRVLGGQKIREFVVSRTHLGVYGGDDGVMQALAVRWQHGFRNFCRWLPESVGFSFRIGDGLTLGYRFFEQEARRQQFIFFALLQNLDQFANQLRHFVQAREVIFVVFGRIERH